MLLIKPSLDDSDKDNTSSPENNPKESIKSLQQPKKADSPKKKIFGIL